MNTQELWADVKKHSTVGLVAVALLLVGFATGRYMTPTKTVTKTEVKVVETEHVVEKEVVKIQIVKVDNTQKSSHHAVYDVNHPDGTKEHHETTDENVKEVVNEQTNKFIDVTHERETIKYVDKLVEKTVERSKPAWRVGAMAGLSLMEASGNAPTSYRLVPSLGPVILGIELDRRILGPISVGAWGLSSGTVGAKLSLEW